MSAAPVTVPIVAVQPSAWREIWNWVQVQLDVPTVVLLFLTLVSLYIGWRAQTRKDFDFGNMLRDEAGKESAVRFGVLGSFAVSSWVLMRESMAVGSVDAQLFLAYLVTWSGALVFVKGVEKWDGHLPWAKGG
jgi:hypothetical protein